MSERGERLWIEMMRKHKQDADDAAEELCEMVALHEALLKHWRDAAEAAAEKIVSEVLDLPENHALEDDIRDIVTAALGLEVKS